jgi:2-polyprenyl-3-methyl-5-hydroxy-6-metoxy-1,4-benzoquinol methylase
MIRKLPQLDSRIPTWNMGDLLERDCPFCDSRACSARFIRPDGLTVNECEFCKAFFVSPAPSDIQLHHFYQSYDTMHRRSSTTPRDLLRTYEQLGPQEDFRFRELISMIELKGCRALDVGFGRGHFMWCLKSQGADVHGIELDESAINIARALGIENVRKATIDDCCHDQPYHLIVLNDLVEHPLHPIPLIQRCVSLLAPRGLILIWTPNGSLARQQESPTTFRVDLEHMQYLTPESCTFVAEKMRLQVVHLETCGFPDLEGLTNTPPRNAELKNNIKRIVKSVPGFRLIQRMRQGDADERLGSYHLFCILRKNA